MSFHVEHSAATLDGLLLEALPNGGVYAVGGRVRDEVLAELGRTPPTSPDLDYLVTGVRLNELLDRLADVGRAELVGASFGVVKFASGDLMADVALPRTERSTGPHHREFEVRSSPDIPLEDDLARRDFRMNMMARDLRTGAIIDPYGGRADIEAFRLDALKERAFVEDPLRVLRGAQFAARFALSATERTARGMRAAAELLPTIAPERLADELSKLLKRARKPSIGFELLRETSALESILPELMEGWGVEQNEFHAYTVYYHALACCDAARPDLVLRLAALLHDVGKPRTKEGGHFYRHEFVGAEMAKQALLRLRFPNDVVDAVCDLIAHHMYQADSAMTDAAVRRFIRRVGAEQLTPLFELRRADTVASGLPARDPERNALFEQRVMDTLEAAPPFGVKDLAIGGDEVISVMREAGVVGADYRGDARVGEALQAALEAVLDDPHKNEPHILRALVRAHFGR